MEKLFNFQDFKYSIRDLTRSYKKISTIIFTLFISLFVLSIIISLEYSLKKELNSNAKILLGGDLEINTRNEKVNDEYLDQLKKLGDVSSTVEFSTMLADSKKQNAKTFFIRLKAVDDKYPLYGNVESFPKDALNLLQKTTNSIVVNKKIFETLNLKINDTVYIKQSPFKVVGYVETVPDLGRALLFGDFAVVSTNSFLKLNINTLGSFINYEYRLKVYDESLNIKDQVINLTKKYPSYSVRFPENSSNNLKKLIDNFSQFLSLVSISAMLIAGIGITKSFIYLKVRSFSGNGNGPHYTIPSPSLKSRSQPAAIVTHKTKGRSMLAREKSVNALEHYFTSVCLWLTQVIPLTNLNAVMAQNGKGNRHMKVHVRNGVTQ